MTVMKEKKSNLVSAVQLTIRILDELALANRAMGVTELADALGETKPRIHRHLTTLKETGVVQQDQATDRYLLGWRVFQLGEAASTQFDLKARAEPYMTRLRDELRETVVLTVPINGRPMVIANLDALYARITISVKPGNRPVPQTSALGRVTMAFSPPEVCEQLLAEPWSRETPRSVSSPRAVAERLERIRREFYDFSDGEVLLGINTLAVPIFRDGMVLAGVFGIVGSVQNIPSPPHPEQITLLQECAAELSAQLNSEAYARWREQRTPSETAQ